MTYNEVKERLNLPDEDITRLLHSLACSKYQILTKTGNSKSITKDDTFSFNPKFTDRMRRIKVPPGSFWCLNAMPWSGCFGEELGLRGWRLCSDLPAGGGRKEEGGRGRGQGPPLCY